jgi:hypothetical protein
VIPIRFSLGGDQGLGVIAAGYPRSEQIPCDSAAPVEGAAAATHMCGNRPRVGRHVPAARAQIRRRYELRRQLQVPDRSVGTGAFVLGAVATRPSQVKRVRCEQRGERRGFPARLREVGALGASTTPTGSASRRGALSSGRRPSSPP